MWTHFSVGNLFHKICCTTQKKSMKRGGGIALLMEGGPDLCNFQSGGVDAQSLKGGIFVQLFLTNKRFQS